MNTIWKEMYSWDGTRNHCQCNANKLNSLQQVVTRSLCSWCHPCCSRQQEKEVGSRAWDLLGKPSLTHGKHLSITQEWGCCLSTKINTKYCRSVLPDFRELRRKRKDLFWGRKSWSLLAGVEPSLLKVIPAMDRNASITWKLDKSAGLAVSSQRSWSRICILARLLVTPIYILV